MEKKKNKKIRNVIIVLSCVTFIVGTGIHLVKDTPCFDSIKIVRESKNVVMPVYDNAGIIHYYDDYNLGRFVGENYLKGMRLEIILAYNNLNDLSDLNKGDIIYIPDEKFISDYNKYKVNYNFKHNDVDPESIDYEYSYPMDSKVLKKDF